MFSLLFFSGVFLFLLISMAAYGATQALISLDLPLTVSAGPIGCVELNTLEGLSDAGLQHLRGTEQVTDAVLRLLALGQVTSATIREK
jgi:hypothetical protein